MDTDIQIPKLNLNNKDKSSLKNFIIELRKIPNNYINLNKSKQNTLFNIIINIINDNDQLNLIFVKLFDQGLFSYLNSINDTMEFYKENQKKTYSEYIRFIERNENFINKEDNTIGNENIKRIISENRLENITIFTFNNNTLRIGASRAYIWYNMTKKFISLEKFYIQELLYVAEANKNKGISHDKIVNILINMYSDVDAIKNIYNRNVMIIEVIKKIFNDPSIIDKANKIIFNNETSQSSMKMSRPSSMPLEGQLSRQLSRQISRQRPSSLQRQSIRRQRSMPSQSQTSSSLQRQRSMPSLRRPSSLQTPSSLQRQRSNTLVEASGVNKIQKRKSRKAKKQKSRKGEKQKSRKGEKQKRRKAEKQKS